VRTPISSIERAVGVFLGAVMALVVVALLATGYRVDLLDAFREGFVLYAVAREGHGTVVGSPVKVLGVEMGTVTAVELRQDPAYPGRPVRLTIRLRPAAEPFLTADTRAVIVEPPLGSGMPPFGTAAVELRPSGSGDARPMARRAVVLAEGEPSMVQTMSRMGSDVSAMRDEMLKAIDAMGTTFSNMRRLTDSLARGEGIAGRVMTDPKLASDLDAMLGDARAATADMRRLMGEMNRVTGQFPATLNETRALSKDGQRVIARLDSAIEALPRLVAATERTLAASEELVISLRKTAGYAPELARKVDVSLEETSRLVESAQKNFILRGNLPDRPAIRTDAEVRPPAVLPPSPPKP